MKILLDSCAFLDIYLDAANLKDEARHVFQSNRADIWVSVATVWEIGLKISIGKLDIDLDAALDYFKSHGVEILNIDLRATLLVNKLPAHHKDPFDRIIIAAAQANGMVIMTSDKIFEAYDVELIKSR